MVKEVESRNKLFAEDGIDSIDEYNKIAKKKMSKIWIVIEEISIFMSDFTSLCSIITFKQNNDISSRVAIDSDLATELNQGEIYCNSSQELVKLNVPNIEFEVLKKYIPSLIISKERV